MRHFDFRFGPARCGQIPELGAALTHSESNPEQLASRRKERPPVRIGMRFRTNRVERNISEMKSHGTCFRDDRSSILKIVRFVDRRDETAPEVPGQVTFQEIRR